MPAEESVLLSFVAAAEADRAALRSKTRSVRGLPRSSVAERRDDASRCRFNINLDIMVTDMLAGTLGEPLKKDDRY